MTTDEGIKALVERLLHRKTINLADIVRVREYLEEDSVLHHETADAISRLTADNEALRAMSDAHREHAQSAVENCASLNRLLSIAEARADALAQALQTIVDTLDAEEMGEGPSASEWSKHWQKLHADARAALGDRP